MDLTEIRAEVRNRLGEDTADYWKDTQVDRAINEGIRRFAREELWPWLYTETTKALAADGTDIVLPTDIDFTRSFGFALAKVSDGEFIEPAPRRVTAIEGFKLKQTYTTSAKPRWYYIASTALSGDTAGDDTHDQTVRFVPPADVAYTAHIVYLRRPATLSSTTAEPDLPEDYHEAVVAWATGSLWETELVGSRVKAEEQYQKYAKVVDDARRDLRKFAEDESVVWGKEATEGDLLADHLPVLPDKYGQRYGWGDF